MKVAEDELKFLKALAAKLPAVPFDLSDKNKELLRRLESDATRARLVFMPEELHRKVVAESSTAGLTSSRRKSSLRSPSCSSRRSGRKT